MKIELSSNQLLAIKNIPRPAIKGKNNGDVSDEYKTIQNFKQELIYKNILHKDDVKKFDNIVNKWKQTKDKEIIYISNKNKVNTRDFDINEIFKEYLNKNTEYKEIESIEKNIKEAIKKISRRISAYR